MCGISVIVALEGHDGAQREKVVNSDVRSKIVRELDESLEMIAHRGPDSRGQWISEDGRVALGHCRLAINDLTPDGHQPMHDVEDGIHAVVNGEIYDYDRIQHGLCRQFGHEFQGHSDSELVIALYKYHGTSFLEQLRGEFALCLYDARTQLFVAARDRYGIKPLFWTIVEGRLLMAAEAKAFLPLGWRPQWDVRALVDDSWQLGSRTLFRGVQKVQPGQYLVCSAFGPVETREYWDMEYPDKHRVDGRSEEAMVAGVRERLVEAIRLRLRADVPVGIYLSGGIDSSALAGIVAHLVRERGEKMGSKEAREGIACFSIGFDKASGLDESDIAERTAAWLGVEHHQLLVGEEELAGDLEEATWHCEHHNMNLNFVGKFALSRLPRRLGYPVVLTGEGSDEQFAGYPMFVPDFLAESDAAMPGLAMGDEERGRLHRDETARLAATLRGRGATVHSHSGGTDQAAARELGGLATATMALAGGLYQPPAEVWARGVAQPRPLPALAVGLSCRAKQRMRQAWHPLHSGLYAWTKCHLANSILSCLGDRTEMAHSVEARTPFLDHGLTEYANGLPPSVKLRYDGAGFVDKWILREAVRPFVTAEVYARRKHAYTAPVVYPVHGPLHRLYLRLLTKDGVDALGFLDWHAVRAFPQRAFVDGDLAAMRSLNLCCQWIILGKRFGIARADVATSGDSR
ncbi:asparagine synthase domain-containing protein [Hirsutella rhossiliensis]|uniref:Asparagine synthase domain-containing protein n=1 Tax=Hirsutella rhossiliensis TaxID=111463 RepID=A0A9P8SEF3_9HYPO|nr:asparagine synthase domain-containing protein [Hirsutella rhossiliensis]KAH0959611.1 asparagine synthase domain-containing protein [Hirsutella rhossiliensis]